MLNKKNMKIKFLRKNILILLGCLFVIGSFAVNINNDNLFLKENNSFSLPDSKRELSSSKDNLSTPFGNDFGLFSRSDGLIFQGYDYDFGGEELGVEAAPQDAYWALLLLSVGYMIFRFHSSKKHIKNQ